MSTWTQLSFQDSASPLMEELIMFHDHAMLVLTLVTTLVAYIILTMFSNKFIDRFLLEGHLIEVIWTVIPALLLIFIALPSLHLLYLLDEYDNPSLTIKSMGHQWYWSYEYSDFLDVEFDSYMIPSKDLEDNQFRLIEVDNRMVVPMNTYIRILVSSTDVIHSWTVPALSVKADAIPGRLNQLTFLVNRPGLFFGQCSEICGANHSFMPIVVESISMNSFLNWINNFE
uniref:Cytochrome c oxidase subunit 2 n=1 Tax=Megabalanus volcano TaxID=266495 RepID=Q65Z11_MEGVO|nr:cytochrome c oxidase subunit II [Megabalanus coccopoma]YP_087059.1 cytochrome c oxidase subunit II [Megabalanus volcano]UZN92552.1 cytochrome c oxidase subunit 2 [Megabalanus coccopoma]BAD44761.1 cytochrome oxidase subunit 2 [Megabalanus volcano]